MSLENLEEIHKKFHGFTFLYAIIQNNDKKQIIDLYKKNYLTGPVAYRLLPFEKVQKIYNNFLKSDDEKLLYFKLYNTKEYTLKNIVNIHILMRDKDIINKKRKGAKDLYEKYNHLFEQCEIIIDNQENKEKNKEYLEKYGLCSFLYIELFNKVYPEIVTPLSLSQSNKKNNDKRNYNIFVYDFYILYMYELMEYKMLKYKILYLKL